MAVARARRVGSELQLDAETTALPDPSAFDQTLSSNLAYSGSASGLYVQSERVNDGRASAVYYPFRASGEVTGAPIPVPTQQNLADRPNRCGTSEIESTPRIDAGFLPGTRHPIVVSDAAGDPRLFLSSGAVLHGTPENACASAFDAEEVVINCWQPHRPGATHRAAPSR